MLDLTKPVRTKGGTPVRIVSTDGSESYPIIGYIEGEDQPETWTREGVYSISSSHTNLDLENAPESIVRWFNLYNEGGTTVGCGWTSQKQADEISPTRKPRIGRVRVEFVPGQWDEEE